MSKTVVVLIAGAVNNLAIPCRIFENMESARKECDKIFGCEPECTQKSIIYRCDLEIGTEIEKEEDENGNWVITKMNQKGKIANTLFTHFYFGCGGPGPFYLKEVEFNTKFVGFDLD